MVQYVNDQGEVFHDPLILEDGSRCYNPPQELLAHYGWHVKAADNPPPVRPAVPPLRFSKLAIRRVLGDDWPAWEAKIAAAGLTGYWNDCTYLERGDPDFDKFWRQLAPAEKRLLIEKCRWEE